MDTDRVSLLMSTGLTLLGSVLIGLSALVSSPIPAFVGLGLIFLALVPVYLRNEPRPLQMNLEFQAQGLRAILRRTDQTIYLPIPSEKTMTVETFTVAEEGGRNDSTTWVANRSKASFHLNRVEAPGGKIISRVEAILHSDLSEVKPGFLSSHVSPILVNDLKLATGMIFVARRDRFQVEIRGTEHMEACAKVAQQTPPLDSLGCELCSAVAIALVKTSGKPIIIEKTVTSLADRTTRTEFRALNLTLKQTS